MSITNLEKLNFFRDEIKHEFGLLGQRLAWYVTCQSFLITSFAISINKSSSLTWFSYVIIAIGICASILIGPAIWGAHRTIKMYGDKKRDLLKNDELIDFRIPRDAFPFADDDIHKKSMYFSGVIPIVFIVIWLIVFILSIFFPLKIVT